MTILPMRGSAKFVLNASTALVIASLLLPIHAHAESLENENTDKTEEIIVTGSALRNDTDVANRKRTLDIVDTLSIDDTGDLADQTLSNALSRIAGVDVSRVIYAESESEYVGVRGITPDLNFTSIDGIGMISVANGGNGTRRVDLGLIPITASSKTEVFKSFNASMDAGAIGGVVNIVPRSAFDRGGETFFIDAFGIYTDRNIVPGGNVSNGYKDSKFGGGMKGLFAKRFGSDGQFGIVLSGEYSQRSYDESKPNPNDRVWYATDGSTTTPDAENWNGFDPAPTAFNVFEYTNLVKTYGGSATFEYNPTSDLYFSLQAFQYSRDEMQGSPQFKFNTLLNLRDMTQTSGTYDVGRADLVQNMKDFTSRNRGLIFKTIYDFNNTTNLAVRAGYVRSDFREELDSNVFRNSAPGTDLTYDTTGNLYSFSLSDPASALNPANYVNASKYFNDMRAVGETYETRFDLSNNEHELGLRFKTGAGIRWSDMARDRTHMAYVPAGNLADLLYTDQTFHPYSWNYPVLLLDLDKFNRDIVPTMEVNEVTSRNNSISSDYSYDERIVHAYANLAYATQDTVISGGLRLDSVNYNSLQPQTIDGTLSDVMASSSGSYTYVLPSANIVHSLTDNIRLKAAYSRSLGRPAPGEIAAPLTRNDDTLVISQGNPDLKPRKSDNFDLSYEHYLGGNAGMFTVSAFYKSIKDDIYSQRTDVLIDGVQYASTMPLNASSSKIGGIEVNYINNGLPLPGFLNDKIGVALNGTRTWGEMEYLNASGVQKIDRLMFQKYWLANASVFYKLGNDSEFRVAYNYQDGYYDSIGNQPWLHRGPQGIGRLDMTLRMQVADDWIVKLQGQNLTGSELYLGQGEYNTIRRGSVKMGRTFMLNIIYKP